MGLSYFWGHLCAVVLSLAALGLLSKKYFFWFLLAIAGFTAMEPRFSLERILMAMSFFACGYSPMWLSLSSKTRKNILLFFFVFLFLTNTLSVSFSEKGSLLLWMPVFLSAYHKQLDKTLSERLVYWLTGFALLFSNKKTAFIAFLSDSLSRFKSKIIYFVAFLLLILSFLLQESVKHFWHKSFEPRIYIWHSTFKAFLDKPLWGHGFGTFSLDFPIFRCHADDIFGARINEQIVHGHNLFLHCAFEQGLIGIALLIILFYLCLRHTPWTILPLSVISLFDAPLVSFNQYLLAGLILIPLFNQPSELTRIVFLELPPKIASKAKYLAYILALMIFLPSLIGHYFYVHKNLDKAIDWDGQNSLYYFMRGANTLNIDTVKSENDLKRAVSLSPHVSYFYGFLAAAQLANSKFDEAKKSIAKAIEYDGGDGYWYMLKAFIYHDDKETFKSYYAKALEINPEIEELIKNPNISASEYIGDRNSDVRIPSFYRSGPKVFLPLPYTE